MYTLLLFRTSLCGCDGCWAFVFIAPWESDIVFDSVLPSSSNDVWLELESPFSFNWQIFHHASPFLEASPVNRLVCSIKSFSFGLRTTVEFECVLNETLGDDDDDDETLVLLWCFKPTFFVEELKLEAELIRIAELGRPNVVLVGSKITWRSCCGSIPDFVNLYSIVVALSHSGCLKTTKQHIEWSVFEQVHQEKYNIIFNNIGYDIRMILQIKMASLPFPPFGQVEYNGRMKHWCRHGVRRFLQLNELMLTRVFVGISVAREVMAGWLGDWMMDLLKSSSWCLKCRLLSFVPASSLSFIVLHYSPFTMYHKLTCDHTLNLVSTEHSMNG